MLLAAAAVAWTTPGHSQPEESDPGRKRSTTAEDPSTPPPPRPRAASPGGSALGEPASLELDRIAVRWHSRATGGVLRPQFIFARELAFEARMEAMTERADIGAAYVDKHVRAAIQRHVSETMLARLPVEPAPTPKQVGQYAEAARLVIEQQVGGRENLLAAARAEALSSDELNALLRRRARASWYLDKMVAPMLEPTELDLREAHSSGDTPFTHQLFDQVAPQVRRWLVATRMAEAVDNYFRNARARVTMRLVLP